LLWRKKQGKPQHGIDQFDGRAQLQRQRKTEPQQTLDLGTSLWLAVLLAKFVSREDHFPISLLFPETGILEILFQGTVAYPTNPSPLLHPGGQSSL
jgi:hypothetical protein